VALARDDAGKLTDEHAVIQAAMQREQTIIERAQKEADGLRAEADEYAKGVLASLDGQLSALEDQVGMLLTTVRNGLNALSQPEDRVLEDTQQPVEDSIESPQAGAAAVTD
jgi:hypothetical protein